MAALNEKRKTAIQLHITRSTVAPGLTRAVSTPTLHFVRKGRTQQLHLQSCKWSVEGKRLFFHHNVLWSCINFDIKSVWYKISYIPVRREENFGFEIYKNHRWREEILKSRWKRMNGEISWKLVTRLLKNAELNNLGIFYMGLDVISETQWRKGNWCLKRNTSGLYIRLTDWRVNMLGLENTAQDQG